MLMYRNEETVSMLPVLLVLLSCLGCPCAATLDFGLVSPAWLSVSVLQLAGNQTAHKQCGEDFGRWMAAISREERWALRMADSWGTSLSGVLNGNDYNLGDFDECIYASSEIGKLTTSSTPVIRGAYLLPSIFVLRLTQGAALNSATEIVNQFRLALCVPDSCDAGLMEAALQPVLGAVAQQSGESGLVAAASLTAGKQSLSTLPRPGLLHWIYLSVVIILVLLAVVATILDKTLDATDSKTPRQRWRFLLHFSLSSGMRRLLAPAPPGSMTCISGIRVLSTLWIMAGHTIDNYPAVSNSWDKKEFDEGLTSRMLTRFALSVDTFLVIGGIVCCNSFLISVEKHGFNWIKYIIRRYARTTPAVVMVCFYGATWLDIASPGVDTSFYGASVFSDWFRDYWWATFLHVTNFFGDATHLICHTWYLSLHMQLYIAAPIVLIPLWKRPFIGRLLLALATLTACLIPGALSVVYQAKSNSGSKGNSDPEYYNFKKMFYFGTHSRMSPYLVGIAAGYFLHQIKYRGLKLSFNKLQVTAMWLLSASLALVVIYAPNSILNDSQSAHPYNAVESFFFLGFTKLAWGVAIALVIIACETGCGGPINKILSWSGFTPLGKLSFSIYLIHFFITLVDMLKVVHVVEYFSFYGMFRMLMSSATMTIPLATLLFLIVEQPFVLFESELWK